MVTRAAGAVAGVLFLGGTVVWGQTPHKGAPDDGGNVFTRVDSIFQQYDKPDSPGCAVGIMRDGELVYAKGYGMADLERSTPITPQTVFEIGSVSKQITAFSVLLLAKDGKLSLDDDIRRYVPELPDYASPITLHHLLHHTSGLRDYLDLLMLAGHEDGDATTEEDALAILQRQKTLNFRPGEEHLYSNSGYFLLGLIVKRVSGMTLREFAHLNIFEPLGMRNTHYHDDHRMIVRHRALAYSPLDSTGFEMMGDWEQVGDAGVLTTVEDLARWDENFYSAQVGSQETIDLMQTVGTLDGGDSLRYALGLGVDAYHHQQRVHHGGLIWGYRSYLARFPELHFSVAVLCNTLAANPVITGTAIADLFLAGVADQKPTPTEDESGATRRAPLLTERATRYAGIYVGEATGSLRRVVLRDSKLFFESAPGVESELMPLSQSEFEIRNSPPDSPREIRVVFQPTADTQMVSKMNVAIEGFGRWAYDAVEPADTAATPWSDYEGPFRSEDLGVTYTVVQQDGRLILRHDHYPEFKLEPAAADIFLIEGGVVQFTRDGQGEVTGLTVSIFPGLRRLPFTKQ